MLREPGLWWTQSFLSLDRVYLEPMTYSWQSHNILKYMLNAPIDAVSRSTRSQWVNGLWIVFEMAWRGLLHLSKLAASRKLPRTGLSCDTWKHFEPENWKATSICKQLFLLLLTAGKDHKTSERAYYWSFVAH